MTSPQNRPVTLLVLALFGIAVFSGCATPPPEDDADGTRPGTNTTTGAATTTTLAGQDDGRVAVYVKDAPADEFQTLFLTFSRVEVHAAGDDEEDNFTTTTTPTTTTTATATNTTTPTGTNDTAFTNDTTTTTATPTTGETGDEDANWIVVVDTQQTIDLLQFTGDARAFLGDETLEAGRYTQIRIFIDEAWGEDADTGERVDVEVPSGELKLVRPWTIEAGMVTELVVDIDVNESLRQTGNDRWILRPTAQVTASITGPSDEFTPTQTATTTTQTFTTATTTSPPTGTTTTETTDTTTTTTSPAP